MKMATRRKFNKIYHQVWSANAKIPSTRDICAYGKFIGNAFSLQTRFQRRHSEIIWNEYLQNPNVYKLFYKLYMRRKID